MPEIQRPRLDPSADHPPEQPENSYLDEIVSRAWTKATGNDEWSPAKQEFVQCTSGILKTAPLFLKGKYALHTAMVLHALDEMNPNDSATKQVVDGTLGAAQGYALKHTFDYIGNKSLAFTTRGSMMGITSRAVDLGLSSDTYRRADGSYGFATGVSRTLSGTFSPTMLAADVVAAYGAGKIFGGTDRLMNGALKASPLYSSMGMGSAYGFVSGTTGELQRQYLAGEDYDVTKIGTQAFKHTLIGTVAAIPGGMQNARAYRDGTMPEAQRKQFDYWRDFRDYKRTEVPVQGKYLREALSYDEYAAFYKQGMKPQEIVDLKREINAVAMPAKDAVIQAAKTHDVIGLAEVHFDPSPHRKFGASIMPDLAKAGVTHLGIEWSQRWQPHLDRFTTTGEIPKAHVNRGFGPGHFEVVKAAHGAGMQVRGVDPINMRGVELNQRDPGMATNTRELLLQQPNAKVALWVGANHLGRQGVPMEVKNSFLKDFTAVMGLEAKPAGAIMRDLGISMATFYDTSSRLNVLNRLSGGLRESIAVPMREAPKLSAMKANDVVSDQSPHPFNQYDYTVMHPVPSGPFLTTRQFASYALRPFLHPFAGAQLNAETREWKKQDALAAQQESSLSQQAGYDGGGGTPRQH